MGDNEIERFAPGWPGIAPRWTSSAKSGVGTALNRHSRVWFTMSHGILNEIYFPRVDQACTRDQGLIVTDGSSFFSEEKRNCKFENVPHRTWSSSLRTDQHRIAGTIPDRERNLLRSLPQRRPAENTLCAVAGHAWRLSSVRSAGSASGELRRGKHRLGGRLQGHAHVVCQA